MKNIYIFALSHLVLLTACYGQSDKNLRDKYHDVTISVDNYNVPTDSNQSYFPLSFFPQTEYVFKYEDSTTMLISTTIGLVGKEDTTRMYAKILPNQFDTFRVHWYSKHLLALNEPFLFNKPTDKVVFRFTWLRTFHNPISIRIEKDSNEYTLYWKVCNGAGGYSPGILTINKHKNLKKSHWAEFLRLIENIDFWELKNNDHIFGTDGSQWILEGSTPDLYQVVDRWSPNKNDEYYKICDYLIELTELKIKKAEKY